MFLYIQAMTFLSFYPLLFPNGIKDKISVANKLSITGPNHSYINPFVPNAPFLYCLKTLENRKVFWYIQGVEKGCFENKWVNTTHTPFGTNESTPLKA